MSSGMTRRESACISQVQNKGYATTHQLCGHARSRDYNGCHSWHARRRFFEQLRLQHSHTQHGQHTSRAPFGIGTEKAIRTLKDNATLRETLTEHGAVEKEFFTFTNDAGVELNCWKMLLRTLTRRRNTLCM